MNELVEAEKALGVVLRGIELFGKEKTFLPCQRLFLNSLLWRDSVHFLQERGYVVIENRRGTFVAPPYKTLQGLQKSLEDKYKLNSVTCLLPDIRPNYPLRVPHFSGEKQKARSLPKSSFKSANNDVPVTVSSTVKLDAPDFSVNEYLNKKRKLEDLYNKPADTIVVSSPGMEIDAVSNETSNSSSEEECETSSVDEDDYIFKEQESMKNIEYALVFQNEDICSMVELSCVNVLANFCKLRSSNSSVEDIFGADDISKKKPKRHRVTKEELDLLESIFQKTSGYPDSESFEKIANELHWDVNKVKKWFQNQRQRQKEKRPKLEESSKNTVTWWPSAPEWREIPHELIQPQPVIV